MCDEGKAQSEEQLFEWGQKREYLVWEVRQVSLESEKNNKN